MYVNVHVLGVGFGQKRKIAKVEISVAFLVFAICDRAELLCMFCYFVV